MSGAWQFGSMQEVVLFVLNNGMYGGLHYMHTVELIVLLLVWSTIL
jgi:hypothetical protein